MGAHRKNDCDYRYNHRHHRNYRGFLQQITFIARVRLLACPLGYELSEKKKP